MDAALPTQIQFFARRRGAGAPLALATIVETQGSTYRKAGARMLIAADGDYAGLLSGGCLENDLLEHARRVLADGLPRRVDYDMRSAEDLLWGMGLGCEGAIGIFLQRLEPAAGFRPFDYIAACLARDRPGAVATVTRSQTPGLPVGTSFCAGEAAVEGRASGILADLRGCQEAGRSELRRYDGGELEAFLSPVWLPPRLLVAGAGPDAVPVVEAAARLGWRISVVDHRAAYADPAHFPAAERVILIRPEALAGAMPLERCDAAVVMSHHLPSDLAYLRVLAASPIGYVGLLGPAARRTRLRALLGPASAALGERLYAPVGLDLGAQTPEAIALAVVAEIQAVLAGRRGGHMRGDRLPQALTDVGP